MKILVTGASGQLGQCLAALAPASGHEWLFTDVAELDITSRQAVLDYFAQHRPDACLNCAAYTAVDKAETDRALAHAINALGAAHLAEACAQAGALLLQVSTDFVFDGHTHLPYREDALATPLGYYGQSKLEGEQLALQHNPRTAVVRTAWLYSEYGNNFAKTMRRLGREREQLGVIFDQVGTPTYAPDLAGLLLLMAERLHAGQSSYGLYHYSNEGVASWYDFACAVFEYEGLSLQVRPLRTEEYPTPAQRPAYSVLDKAKVKADFGISIPHWRTSLRLCLQRLRALEAVIQ